MADDQQQIRALIERWAAAVHAGDMDRVLADHSDEIAASHCVALSRPRDLAMLLDGYTHAPA